jgi:hypothetical protein
MYVICSLLPQIYSNLLYRRGNLQFYTDFTRCLVEIISWITKVLFMKEASKLPFSKWREQGYAREHSEVKNDKLEKKIILYYRIPKSTLILDP